MTTSSNVYTCLLVILNLFAVGCDSEKTSNFTAGDAKLYAHSRLGRFTVQPLIGSSMDLEKADAIRFFESLETIIPFIEKTDTFVSEATIFYQSGGSPIAFDIDVTKTGVVIRINKTFYTLVNDKPFLEWFAKLPISKGNS